MLMLMIPQARDAFLHSIRDEDALLKDHLEVHRDVQVVRVKILERKD